MKVLSAEAWDRFNGWEVRVARDLHKGDLLTDAEARRLRKIFKTVGRGRLLELLSFDENRMASEFAHMLGVAAERLDLKFVTAAWGSLLRNLPHDVVDELNRESRDERTVRLVESIAIFLEASSQRPLEEESIVRPLRLLEEQMGLRRWKSPLPRDFHGSLGVKLAARHATVPFCGRIAELADLQSWLFEKKAISVRRIEGDGGFGKTRLAAELCRTSALERWRSGFLPDVLGASQLSALCAARVPRLVVVDYAEARLDLPHILDSLWACRRPDAPIRILLLERTPKAMAGSTEAIALHRSGAVTSIRTGLPLDDRKAIFLAANRVLARGAQAGKAELIDFSSETYASPLLNVLAAALTKTGETAGPVTREELYEALVEHEARYWKKANDVLADRDREQIPLRLAKPLVSIGALFGLPGSDSVVNPLSTFLEQENISPGIAVRWLSELYEEGVLPLDPLADYIASQHLPDSAIQSCFESVAISNLRPLVVLYRAAVAWADLRRRCEPFVRNFLDEWLAMPPGLTTREVGEGIRICIELLGPNVSEIVRNALRANELSVHLLSAALSMEELLRDHSSNLGTSERIEDLRRLAIRRAELRFFDEALEAAQQAWELAQTEDSLPVLVGAGVLNLFSVRLAAVGSMQSSLEAVSEAIQLLRGAVEKNESGATRELANVLNTLSIRQAQTGEPAAALASIEEADALYRELGETDPSLLTSADYLRVLNTLCIRLSNNEKEGEALEVARHGVRIAETLSDRDRRMIGQLGHSLILLVNRQLQLGNYAEAKSSAEKAVGIFRELANLEPAANQPTLAAALNALFGILFELNDPIATTIERECVSVYRVLATRSDSFSIYLVASLANLLRSLVKFGDPENILQPVADEALSLIEALPAQSRKRPEIVLALSKLREWLDLSPHLKNMLARLDLLPEL